MQFAISNVIHSDSVLLCKSLHVQYVDDNKSKSAKYKFLAGHLCIGSHTYMRAYTHGVHAGVHAHTNLRTDTRVYIDKHTHTPCKTHKCTHTPEKTKCLYSNAKLSAVS